MPAPETKNPPRSKLKLIFWGALALALLVSLGCCVSVCSYRGDPLVVKPYTGKKKKPREGPVTIASMNTGIWGDHAYDASDSLGTQFNPDAFLQRCAGSEWRKTKNKKLPKPSVLRAKSYTPKSVDLYHCRPTHGWGPSPIQGNNITDRYALTIDGLIVAYYFERTRESEREAKNMSQLITNFRLRHNRCKLFDPQTNVHQCFQVFSQVEHDGTRVVLIHAVNPVYTDIAHELAFGGEQRSRTMTAQERKVIEKCRPLDYKCW